MQVNWSDFDHKFYLGLMLQRQPAECPVLLRLEPQQAAAVPGPGAPVLEMRLRGQDGDAHSRGLRHDAGSRVLRASSLVIVIYSDQYLLWPCPGDFSF